MNKKKVIHIHNEYPEHDWKRNKDGSIDMWALDVGYHNGPMCQRCYESFCEHCNPHWDKEGHCVEDYYKCPECGKILYGPKSNFCSNCGQALDWSK
jgi:hypothetical protein